MKLWQRIVVVIVAVTAIYLWHHEFHGAEGLVLTVAALFMGRLLYTSKVTNNLLGESRDYSIKPVLLATAKGVVFFVVAYCGRLCR